MAKRNMTIYKTLHRKQKIEQLEPYTILSFTFNSFNLNRNAILTIRVLEIWPYS